MKKLVSLVFLVLSSGVFAKEGTGNATLIYFEGTVTVQKEGVFQLARIGMGLAEKDAIKTERESSAEIRMVSGRISRIKESSFVKISDLIELKLLDEGWLDKVWGRVQRLKSRPHGEATAVMGLRGADEAGRIDRFWGEEEVVVPPSRMDLEDAILNLQEISLESEYLMGALYLQLGDDDKACSSFQTIIDRYKETPYAKEAAKKIETIKKQREPSKN